MKKSLLIATALCSTIMTAEATLHLDPLEVAAWENLNQTEFSSNDYTGEWGRLMLTGKQLCDQKGNPIQLRGWNTSIVNSGSEDKCLTPTGFDAMKAWGANIVRLPISSKNYSSATDDAIIEKYIRYATERKMYVLVDWDVYEEDAKINNPATYKQQALEMFDNISKFCRTKGYSNVLYEICGETSGVTWDSIKSYANEVLPVIQTNDPDAIVIVGTPQWDQNIGDAVNSPIQASSYPNLGIMYAFHISACSHAYLFSYIQSASASLPCFVSEWNSARFDGLGSDVCTDYSNQFLEDLKSYNNNGSQLISWCYEGWNMNGVASSCLTDCSDPFNTDNLAASGVYITEVLGPRPHLGCILIAPYYTVQDIPMDGENYGVLNVGWFDFGGEGVGYHDANSTIWADNEQTVYDTTGIEYKNCNGAAVLSGKEDLTVCFRYDECVDVTGSIAGLGSNFKEPGDGLGNDGSDLHSLIMTEPGEWMLYEIDVKKAGYYSVKCLTNSSTNPEGSIGMAIANGTQPYQNGNIIRSWSNRNSAADADALTSMHLNPTPDCGLMYDGTINAEGAANGTKADSSTCWGWTSCGGATAADTADLVVLFKYTGSQKLIITVSPDTEVSPGEFSNFAFTLVSDEISDAEFDLSTPNSYLNKNNEQGGVEATVADLNKVGLYPNPATGDFTVKLNGAATISIYDAVGAKVYSKTATGDVVVNNSFAPGIYVVRVVTTSGEKAMKLVVK